MSAYGGPNIVEDGLVLALDAANIKSFRGEPTTNEIVSVTWSGDGGNQTSFTKGSTLVTDNALKYNGYETYLWAPGTNRNCYIHSGDLSTGRTSTVWTFSCYVKREDGAPITSLNVYMYYPSSDGSAAGTVEDVGNGWYRVSRTRSGANNYLSLIGFTGFVAEKKYYLSGAQLEKKTYPTPVTPTNTTRGTTVATGGGWADRSGNYNHGELVNGPTYNSSNLGSLVFDGTNDEVKNFPFQLPNSGSKSVFVWFILYLTSRRGLIATRPPGTLQQGWGFTVNRTAPGNLTMYHTGGSLIETPAGIQTGIWYQACFVHDTSTATVKLYVNGVQVGSTGTSFSIPSASTSNGVVGNEQEGNTGQIFNGRIASVLAYNRPLSASEVLQNYNATRERFGL